MVIPSYAQNDFNMLVLEDLPATRSPANHCTLYRLIHFLTGKNERAHSEQSVRIISRSEGLSIVNGSLPKEVWITVCSLQMSCSVWVGYELLVCTSASREFTVEIAL